MARLDRRSFLAALGAGALTAGRAEPAAAQHLEGYPRLDYGLVLSGGGAKGAYEAGVIQTLARGISDGMPLRPYGGVAGTSIGALNGWFVATGQYSTMRRLWMNVASDGVFRLKPEFSKIVNPDAGVANRLAQAVHLASGVRKDVQGLCQTAPALEWIPAVRRRGATDAVTIRVGRYEPDARDVGVFLPAAGGRATRTPRRRARRVSVHAIARDGRARGA